MLFFVPQISQIYTDFMTYAVGGFCRFFCWRFVLFFVPQISQIYTDFMTYAVGGFRRFFVRIFGGFFLPIMARMNLCKSVVSVGLFNGG